MAARIKLNRDQLYSMAALASFGVDTEMVISLELWDEKDGKVVVAIRMRKDVPPQRKKDTHKNGWAYYEVSRGRSGLVKPLTEKELKQR